ncbi:MAG: SemiSWEET transporter [Endomicrobia bacterium]|nr:SemiSWEET transporter [Endomicrobiia bacterium]MCL2506205.1 SemiSWEET transporter [Endomicrobiia bacterium]
MFSLKLIGYFAGFFSTIAFIPQVYKTWKSKSAKDVSMHMFVIFSLGVFLWLIYGITVNDLPIILTNCVILVLALTQVILKIKYDKTSVNCR